MTDLISFSNYLFVFINCHAEKFEIRLGETYKRVPFLAFPKTWRLKRQDDESALIDRPDERTIEEIGEEVSARRGGREGGGGEGERVIKKCPEISDGLNRLICIRYGHRKRKFMDM